MRIVSYDQLRDPVGFAIMSDSAFHAPVAPRQVAERRRHDPRYRDPYGFAMLERGRPVGFVGVLDIKVRTRTGEVVDCGGIHNVMTSPSHARRGIARRLFEHTHDYFRSRGYPFSFLGTSQSLVAWRLYNELGYAEMPLSGKQAPAAYLLREVKGKLPKPLRSGRPDYSAIEELFGGFWSRRRCTFADGTGWLAGRMEGWHDTAANIIAVPGGFAYVETGHDAVRIYELVARNPRARAGLLGHIERLNRPAIVHYSVNDPTLLGFYRDRGFSFRPRAFYVMMAKSLGRTSLRAAFGTDFSWSPLDQF
jgi:GNAT superfamily N-acetyltransferase